MSREEDHILNNTGAGVFYFKKVTQKVSNAT